MVKKSIKKLRKIKKDYERLGKILIFVIFLNLCNFSNFYNCLYAYSSLNSYYGWGEQVRGLSAKSVGLGSVSVALPDDVGSIFTNPACMMKISEEHKGMLSVSPSIVWSSDKRDHSYSATSYTTNRNIFFQPDSAGMLWSSVRDFVFGLGASTAYDYSYKFEEKSARDRGYGSAEGEDTVNQLGQLFNYGCAMNYNYKNWLSVGFGGYARQGDVKSEKQLITYGSSGSPDIVRKIKTDSALTGGFAGSVGFLISDEEIGSVGLVWTSGSEIRKRSSEKDTTGGVLNSSSSYTVKYNYPQTVGFGFRFNFKDAADSSVFVDTSFTAWSDARTKIAGVKTDPLFIDVWEYHIGFEHKPFSDVIFRYGFSYLPSYIATGEAVSSISFGCGFYISMVEVDIAGDYARQKSVQERLFFEDTGQRDSVKDTTTRLISSVRYRWK